MKANPESASSQVYCSLNNQKFVRESSCLKDNHPSIDRITVK